MADGQVAGVGDEVVTRENNRLLSTGRRWVKNGDRWLVRATNADGSMAVRRLDGQGEVVLPADYVREHVELAYATTAYRAQGRTVATAHALVSPTTTREVLYVSATRGREENRLYVDTCFDPDPPTSHPGLARPQSPRAVLAAVLAREGAEVSAHEAIRRAQREAGSFAVLAAEYSSIARDAQQQRFDALLGRCGLAPAHLASAQASEAYGPLLAAVRDAEARGLDIESGATAAGCRPDAGGSRRPHRRPARPGRTLGRRRHQQTPGQCRPHRRPRPPGARRGRRGPGPRPAGTRPGHGAPGPGAGRTGAGRGPSLGAEPRAGAHRGGPEGSLAAGCLHRGCVPGPLGARR